MGRTFQRHVMFVDIPLCAVANPRALVLRFTDLNVEEVTCQACLEAAAYRVEASLVGERCLRCINWRDPHRPCPRCHGTERAYSFGR